MAPHRLRATVDLLIPQQGPRGRGQIVFAVAHAINVSNSHTKYGWISYNGLGDSITVGWTEFNC